MDHGNPVTDVVKEEAEAVAEQAPADDDQAMPLPTEPRTIFLGGLFVLALLAALYAASEIMLPIVLAIVLKLMLQPFVRILDRCRVPRAVGALLAVLLLLMVFAGLVSALTGPATDWAGKLPEALPKVREKLAFLHQPIDALNSLWGQVQGIAGNGQPRGQPPPQEAGRMPNLLAIAFTGTAAFAGGLFLTLLVLFYLLVSGETFLRRLVEVLPRYASKRQAVEISLHIERNISVYLLTITLINLVVGMLTLVVMWACGVGNPLLWGTVAFLLNFIPFLGPMAGLVIFLMASILSLGVTWWALLPVGLYLCIHLAEGELITPMLMARRFTINPVAVILALVFWYWMWGVPGAILAVPMLAITKIVCDDLRPLRAFGHFLEG
jgi:predicted PurR-regulated permease PerM